MIEKPLLRPCVWVLLLILGNVWPARPAEAPRALPPDPAPLPSVLHCPVDGDVVKDRRFGVLWSGRRYYMDRQECRDGFLADPAAYAQRIEPRSALFRSPRPDRPSFSPALLIVSIVIVLGMLSGGVASYLAIQKGLSGGRWFTLGLFLNVLAIFWVTRRPGREVLFRKKGLSKVPQTHEPASCPACGAWNHPSASRCRACDTGLQPVVVSEVARAL